jgi:hypothetical protein
VLSVVLPVRNEHENIGRCLEEIEKALRDVEYEILVSYDSEDDTTLPAIERLERRPRRLRLVRNQLGPSPSLAIRAGLSAAEGDVVVVTMADLSDPAEAILRMAEKIRGGADVVSGSRYMRGGRQIGGPRVKTALSRAAGLSLCWIAGVRTHDATTSFRAFSRRLLDLVPLESDTGFTFGLEATVKAHRRGLRVDEVPVTWSDRSAGQSNFHVGPWLGAYLEWYALAMAEPLLIWSLWLAVGIKALGAGRAECWVALFAVSSSFAVILAARRLRGRMLALDGVIPLSWLALLISASGRGVRPLGLVAVALWSAVALLAAHHSGRRRVT